MNQSNFSLKLLLFLVIFFYKPAISAELQTTPVTLTSVQHLYHLDGLVEAVHQSTISSQTTGQVEKVFFDVEDFVQQGQEILLINDSEQQASLDKAAANLKQAKAGLQDAQDEHTRIKGVFEKKLVSTAEMDKANAALKKAKANHEAALASLEQARKQLGYTRVTAPYTGIVTQRHIEPGEIAQPGMPLMSGISLDKLRVVVDVPQNLISAVRREGKAIIQTPGNGLIHAEKLTVFPFAEKSSNTFKVRLELPAGVKNLLPGMFVKVSFVAGTKRVLLVPRQAVVYRSEVIGVYTVDAQGHVMFRHIRIGHDVNSDQLIVLSGLKENDQVALDPVSAGAALKLQRKPQGYHE